MRLFLYLEDAYLDDPIWAAGQPLALDYMLPEKPSDLEMRESASL
jgi:hypothetical protein